MSETAPTSIDLRFTGAICTERNSGWNCVVVPASGEYFGTRNPVKIGGVVEGTEFRATLLPIGDGTHMVPLKAALRKAIGKQLGDEVTVHLTHRY